LATFALSIDFDFGWFTEKKTNGAGAGRDLQKDTSFFADVIIQ